VLPCRFRDYPGICRWGEGFGAVSQARDVRCDLLQVEGQRYIRNP